ncbi:type I polyketide synthase [Pseudophaeobacter arcticus]|uniref:type I polyketide synthase n=2 Tax=Pseudophaeobacter arcticus TaxID=385492 RepID=UPI0024905A39|nr:type I polyketide synthase [Pseudophaeobacter arcticus]
MSAIDFDDSAIAVVGMACRLPGAPDIDAFWELLAEGRDVISRFTPEELLAAGIPAEEFQAEGYVAAKGLLQDADCFDADFFGLAPSDAALMDPQQRVFIECAHSALEHAGYGAAGVAGAAQVGVFGGSILSMYLLSHLWPNKPLLDQSGVFSVAVGNDPTFLATRTSYFLNLSGPSMSLGTACSTGLVAVHQACQSLLALECDMALAGGVSIHLPLVGGYRYTPGSILSPDGACRPFDAAAAGTVSSDGCGVVTLKRLEDAQADGDTIHAVIRGSAVNNDGHDKIGFTAPSLTPQARVIAEAQELAGTAPDSITLIEAHAAGTSVGDPVELAALKEVFAQSSQACAIGSVKSNIGHVDAASGIAGLIKAVLALRHGAIPPSVHFSSPNPALGLEDSCFYVPQQLQPHDPNRGPMRAGVSSFGIGGTNCHVVLQAPAAVADQPVADQDRPAHLLQLSARSAAALTQMAQQLADALEHPGAPDLADVAHTLRCGRAPREQRLSLVASSLAEATGKLRQPLPAQSATPRRLAFMFPGLGDHYPAMGWELYCQEPFFRAQIDLCATELAKHRSGDIRDQLFAGKDWTQACPESVSTGVPAAKLDMRAMLGRGGKDTPPDPLEDPVNGQAAIFVTEYALAQLLQSWGLQPSAMTGYSIGEFVAACLAGVFTLPDALRIVAARAALIRDRAAAGGMLAVPLGEDELLGILPVTLSLAAANGPRLSVVSGPDPALSDFATGLRDQGHSCQRLAAGFAYHSAMMAEIVPALSAVIRSVALAPPAIPCVSCVTGDWLSVQEATDPEYWAGHLCQTVRFRDAVTTLLSQDGMALAELGPGQSLCSHAIAAAPATGHNASVAPMMRWSYARQPEYQTLLQGIGALWCAGVEVDPARLMADRSARRVPLPSYPFARQRHWIAPPAATIAPERAARKPVADWALVPLWKPAPLALGAAPPARAHYVVLMDGSEAATALLQALRDKGAKATAFWPDAKSAVSSGVLCAPLNDRDTLVTLIQSLPAEPDLPLHFLHLDLLRNFDGFETTQRHGYHALVALVQAIAATRQEQARITLVGTGLADPGQDDRLQPDKRPVLGAMMVAPQERPGLTTQVLDLDTEDPTRIASLVLGNLAPPLDGFLIAYRRGRRMVETQAPLTLPQPQTDAETDAETEAGVIRADGSYVITGGLGGVGLVLAQSLASRGPVRLALLSRTVPDPHLTLQQIRELDRDHPTRRRFEAIRALRKCGAQVMVLAADVADATAMEVAFERIEDHLGPIRGVFHCAGAIDTQTFCELTSETPENAARQFQAKVYGTQVLDQLLQTRAADFCVLMSSLASQLGGLGFSSYAAANLYLDAFAEARNNTGGTRWVSVNWDAWQLGEVKSAVSGFGTTVSTYFMEPEAACDLLLRVLAQREVPRVIVSSGDLEQRRAQWVERRNEPVLERQARQDTPVDLARAQTPTQEVLVEIWQDLFALEPIGIHENFFALGGHSLLATQLNARIASRLGADLSLAAVLNAPSIAELADKIDSTALEAADPQLLDGLLSELEELSDEDLQALLAQEGSA